MAVFYTCAAREHKAKHGVGGSGTDRRRSILNLSEAGRQVHNEIAPLALAFEHDLLQGIDARDYETFNLVVERLLAKAQTMGAPA